LLELIERDSTALWWYNRILRPGVDLASFQDPRVDQLLAAYRDRGRAVWVLDLTADLGIPAMVAVAAPQEERQPPIIFGFGAHLDARIALGRALTEMHQMHLFLPETQAHLEKVIHKVIDKAPLEWLQSATLADHPYLAADPNAPRRVAADYPRLWSDDLREDIHRLQSILEARGLEVLVLDQTRPDVDLKVVRVIVPGLRHFWARFAPGRLYDVPVELGWLPGPLREEELNPTAMFM
jgi:ribosomal protein S12 methylthiotransferase accessory factor